MVDFKKAKLNDLREELLSDIVNLRPATKNIDNFINIVRRTSKKYIPRIYKQNISQDFF
jgi:hypothetical protein